MRDRIVTIGAVLMIAAALFAEAQDSPWGDEPWPPVDGGGFEDGADSPWPGDAARDTGSLWPGDAAGSTPSYADFGSLGAFSLYGYLATTAQAFFGDAGDDAVSGDDVAAGVQTRLRLKGDWEPDENVLVHLEIESKHQRGVSNGYALMQSTGLDRGSLAAVQAASPQDDFRNVLYVDQAWAQLRFDRVDYQVGRVPIAWGTGYAFNPTARTNPIGGLTEIGEEETRGTAAVTAAIALPMQASIEGYVAFEDRLHTAVTVADEVEYWNVPWGARLRALVGSFDIAVGAVHEVASARAGSGFERYLHATGETVGSIGDLGMYAEARLTTPQFDGEPDDSEEWDPGRALVSTVGLEYLFPGDIDAKVEYYRQGTGATDTDAYDLAPVLSGHADGMARDYGFILLQRTFMDYLDVSAAALVNLNDGSGAALPGAEYAVSDAISVSATVIVPWGSSDSEFGGSSDTAGVSVRLVRPAAIVQAKVSF